MNRVEPNDVIDSTPVALAGADSQVLGKDPGRGLRARPNGPDERHVNPRALRRQDSQQREAGAGNDPHRISHSRVARQYRCR